MKTFKEFIVEEDNERVAHKIYYTHPVSRSKRIKFVYTGQENALKHAKELRERGFHNVMVVDHKQKDD